MKISHFWWMSKDKAQKQNPANTDFIWHTIMYGAHTP